MIPSKLRTSGVHRRGTRHVKGRAAKDRVEGQAADVPAAEPVHNPPAEPAMDEPAGNPSAEPTVMPTSPAGKRAADNHPAGRRRREPPAATLPGSTPAGVATQAAPRDSLRTT